MILPVFILLAPREIGQKRVATKIKMCNVSNQRGIKCTRISRSSEYRNP